MKIRLQLSLFILVASIQSFAQIPTTGLIKEYLFTSGSLQNENNPGTDDLIATGAARTSTEDLLGTSGNALMLNGDSFDGGVRGASTVEERMQMSLSFWIKTSTNSTTEQVIFQQYASSGFGPYGWNVYLIEGKIKLTVKALINGAVVTPEVFSESEVIADGEWHHIVCRLDRVTFYSGGWTNGPQTVVYTDGEFSNSAKSGGASRTDLIYMNPGSVPFSIAPSGSYQGELDNIRVYNSTIAEADVVELFKEYLASQSQIYVDASATGLNNGLSWDNAFADLQSALQYVDEQDIWVAAGTYTPHASDRTSSFNIPTNVSVYGGFNRTETQLSERDFLANKTILSGDLSGDDAAVDFGETTRTDNSYHVIEIDGDSTVLDGLIISGGQADATLDDIAGAGIFKAYTVADLTVKNCVIKDNLAVGGAGVYTRFDASGSGSVTVENCIFSGNVANHSAGFYTLTYNNSAAQTIDVSVVGSLFHSNVVKDDGTNYLGYAASSISQYSYGYMSVINVDIINCTFAENQDLGTNAAMSSTNRATVGLSQRTTTYQATLNANIHNSIFWGNTEVAGALAKSTAAFFAETATTLTASNSIDEDGFSNLSGGDLTNTSTSDPVFADATNKDFSLDCSSPAIDAGDETNLTLPATDLEGDVRTLTTIDMGAYEFNNVFTAITAVAQDITVALDESGNATITAADVDGGSGAACGVDFALTLDIAAFDCSNLGPNSVTLTATETGGASANTTATVTIVDNKPPTVSLQSITVDIDATGNASITSADVDNGSSDNCTAAANLIFDLSASAFTCADIGDQTVMVIITDESGNVDSAEVVVTVQDLTAPVISVQDVTLTLGESGSITLTESDINNGTTDDCNMTFTFSQSEFNCAHLGANTVTVTVTDDAGNESTADVAVTIESYIVDQTVTSASAGSFCVDGASSATVTLESSQTGVDYYLRNSQDNSTIEGPVSGTGSSLDFSTGVLSETITVNVYGETSPAAGKALSFDGTDDYVTAPINSSFDFVNGFTAEAWVKSSLSSTTGYSPIFSFGDATESDVEVLIQEDNNLMVVSYNRGKTSGFGYYYFSTPPDDMWYHLAVTYDGTTTKVYYDGVEQSIVSSSAHGAVNKSANSQFVLGYLPNSAFAAYANHQLGQIDEVRLWSSARTSTEILADNDQLLNGDEANLSAYYNFEDGSGTIASDLVASNDGTLTNMDAESVWVSGAVNLPNCGLQMFTELTIGDSEAPTAVAQDFTASLDANGGATIAVADIDNGSGDNCTAAQNLQMVLDITSFTCADLGSNSVTLTVTDESGNEGTATATVTVIDDFVPTALVQDLTVNLDASGNASITAAEINNGSSDNCSSSESLVISLDKTTFSCADLGENTVTFTTEDASGNQNTTTVTVTVVDDLAPTVVTQDMTLQLDATGNVALTAAEVDNGSADNCTSAGNLTLSIGTTSFDCSSLGTNTIILTVEDESGNQSTADATITVVDQIAPTVVTKDIAVNLGSAGTITIAPSDIDDGSSDNCTTVGDLSFSLDISSFTQSEVGANTVTLTVQDANGNSATGQATVTVIDKTPQTITFVAIPDRTYGDSDLTLEATSDSDLSVSFSVISGPATIAGSTLTITGAGDVTVEASQAGDDTFAEAVEQQTFTVDQASLTVTADDQTMNYGSSLPEFTYTFAGFENGDDESVINVSPSASTTATSASNVGTYDITLSGGSDDNYALTLAGGTLTIVQADQSITFDAIADVDIATTSSVDLFATASSGLAVTYTVSDGDGSISGSTLTLNASGSFTVVASQGGDANYNAASDESQTFTVTDSRKQDQTITFNTVSDQVYGDAITLDATASSSLSVSYELVKGEGTIVDGVLTITGIGDYLVRASQGGDESFNSAASVEQAIAVSKAILTYVADDQAISEGEEIPTLTYTVTGFKLSDGESDVDVVPEITTTATSSSPAATYPITLEGGSDSHYEFRFEVGTLTIEAVLGFDKHADVLVYPTPSEGLVTVEMKKAGGIVEIYDLNGVRIRTFESGGNKLELDMRDLSNGQYLMKYYIDDETTTTRLLIER